MKSPFEWWSCILSTVYQTPSPRTSIKAISDPFTLIVPHPSISMQQTCPKAILLRTVKSFNNPIRLRLIRLREGNPDRRMLLLLNLTPILIQTMEFWLINTPDFNWKPCGSIKPFRASLISRLFPYWKICRPGRAGANRCKHIWI